MITKDILRRHGCPIHYWLSGAGEEPLVVFAHGAGADHHMFDKQLATLAGKYPTLNWDVRGHGCSRPIGDSFSIGIVMDDLLAVLDSLGVSQAIFVGQSMGGNMTQELVRVRPERVIAAVLVDCACNTFPLSAAEQWTLGLMPALLRLYPREMLLRQSARAASVKPEAQAYLYKAMGRLTKPELAIVLQATAACLRPDLNYRIPRPFMLVCGEHDTTGAIKQQAPRWAAQEPNGRYVAIPGAGHCANQDNPEVFNRLLLEFLREQSRRQ